MIVGMNKILAVTFASVLLTVAGSGCLKTRAQLRDDGDTGGSEPVAANVQAVEPQGQYVIDELKSEITRLTGRIEDLEREGRDQAANPQQAEQTKAFETRIIELETAQANMLAAIQRLESNKPATEPKELLEQGRAQLGAGNFQGAVDSLSKYLGSSKAAQAEEATFLRGEAYFALNDYKKAIVDYSKFPEKYTRSRRMPTALYKIGQSFEALGMKDDAKGFYQELVDKFPASAEAKKAKPKLK